MPKFILEITLGNDAMRTVEGDVADALEDVVTNLRARLIYCSHQEATGKINIRDRNGNTVGSYQVVE